MKLNCIIFSSLYLCCIFQLTLLSQGHGSLLPFSDRPLLPKDLLFDDIFDPFRVLEQVPLALEREETMSMLPAAAKVDWKETPESHVIKLDVPGLKKEELKIEVEENRVLLVTGERKREEEEDEKDHHWHRVERSYGKFWRRFRLPENVDLDRVEAKLENGVLVISMPKLSPDMIKGPKVVEIEGDSEANRQKISSADEPKQEL